MGQGIGDGAGSCGDGADVVALGRRLRDVAGRVAAVVADTNWHALGGGELLELTADLAAARDAVEFAVASGVAAVDRCGVAEIEAGHVAKVWMANDARVARATAGRWLAAGRVLVDFPLFAAAVQTGAGGARGVSMCHVQVLANAVNARARPILQEMQEELVVLAAGSTPEQWRRDLQRLVAVADMDGAEPACRDRDTLSLSRGTDGQIRLRGTFSGDQAVVLGEALQAELSRQVRAAANDADHGVRQVGVNTLQARALIELIRRSNAHGSDGRAPRCDAVVVIEEPFPGSGSRPWVSSLDGEPLDAVTAAIIACAAELHPLRVDAEGRPLRYGRTRRLASVEQRRALAVRDGGCVFPGCDAPVSWCDAHHIPEWHDPGGGPGEGRTDIDTMALLCRRHHGLAHNHNWTLQHANSGEGEQRFEWVNHRTGATHPAQHRHRPRIRDHSRRDRSRPPDDAAA